MVVKTEAATKKPRKPYWERQGSSGKGKDPELPHGKVRYICIGCKTAHVPDEKHEAGVRYCKACAPETVE